MNNDNYQLHSGDCLELLATLPDNSVDSIVTDPPYGLSFMGKKWDYDVPKVEIWKECLRVLKPGGHLLAFAGTRTQHRMAVRIEDAGFEIRDMIAWVYGSGFPKSLDVSKAIDKCNGETGRLLKFTEWMRTTGLSSSQINKITGTNMGGHYLTAASQPAIPTSALWAVLRPFCGDVPEWVDQLVQRIEAEREVISQQRGTMLAVAPGQENDRSVTVLDITAPATEAAQQWQGWGTALKPALEPITVARKPLIGTVAQNVLEHGTGAINVDGCRVGTETITQRLATVEGGKAIGAKAVGLKQKATGETTTTIGRWPANLIHDGSEEVTELLNDAARFFYCAKASKKDRDEGLESFSEAKTNDGRKIDADNAYQRGATLRKNIHPTVKPTDLMRYLCRLVTPKGGLVLDPFTGSGSTGKAAMLEGFRFIGAEMNPEYVAIAKARIESAVSLL